MSDLAMNIGNVFNDLRQRIERIEDSFLVDEQHGFLVGKGVIEFHGQRFSDLLQAAGLFGPRIGKDAR